MSRRIDTTGKTSLSVEQQTARQGGKLVFTTYNGQQAAFLIRDDRLRAAQLFPRAKSKIGAVYIGKVKNAARNLNAYFVEIGGEEREICFLSEKDAAHPFLLNRNYDGRILEGDEFPVQVTKDAAKNKQASVTTLISLSNPYFALSVGASKIGYSNKLTPAQKERFSKMLHWDGQKNTPAGLPTGIVVRTRAAELLGERAQSQVLDQTASENTPNHASDQTASENTPDHASDQTTSSQDTPAQTTSPESMPAKLEEALAEIEQRFAALFATAAHRTCFSCLLDAPAPWETAFEQLAYPYEYDEILTDDRELYGQLLAAKTLPADKPVRLYDEKQSAALSLTKLYGLESKMDTALHHRVWLKSGGYLVIDPTEALTVIDVNSGKYEDGRAAEDTYLRVNREAAEEIALQLRLRNLSGMIVVDFINMRSREQQEALLQYLRSLVKHDRQKTTVVDMTPLGLVEITRKKSSKPLVEQIEAIRKPGTGGMWA